MWLDAPREAADCSRRWRFGADVPTARRIVHHGDILLEDSSRDVTRPLGRGYSDRNQVVFPYFGAFGWRVGKQHRLVDANCILLVTGGQEFDETHPHECIGHASAILTPSDETLDELGLTPRAWATGLVTIPLPDKARIFVHRLLSAAVSRLESDELSVGLLRSVARGFRQRRTVPSRSVVQKTKQILHERGYEPLSLSTIAKEVGVSPVYLTQAFSRSEGIPLYRYQMRLRLSRALFELPRRESLIELALDLGFSSHSHFSSAFRTAFGTTPSQFRWLCTGGRDATCRELRNERKIPACYSSAKARTAAHLLQEGDAK